MSDQRRLGGPTRRGRHGNLGRLIAAATMAVVPAFAVVGPAHAGTALTEDSSTSSEPEPGTVDGGAVVKQGWWARSNQPPPETGVLAPPTAPAPAAPKGTLPVAQVAGEPERIAALEIGLDGKDGDLVESVVLVLRESADPAANPNSAQAAVVACPVSESFWVGTENGSWTTKPTYDCEAGMAPGVRDELGVWTFDLTSLASAWLDPDSDAAPAVVLTGAPPVEGAPPADPAAAPGSFQVAFDTASGLGLLARTAKVKPVKNDDGPPAEEPAEEADPVADSGSGSGADVPASGSSGDLGSVGGAEAAPLDSGAAVGAVDAAPAQTAASTTGAEAAAPVVSPVAAPAAVPWHADLGRGLLLLPVVALLAYLCMLALGPAGQPVPDQGRRGVSRALERLRTTSLPFAANRGRA